MDDARTSPPASVARGLACALALLAAAALGGCKTLDEPGAHYAGHTLIDPKEVHPILVSQEPTTMNLTIAPGAHGLTSGQAAQVDGFLRHFRAADAGNSKLVIAVPSGGPNTVSVMRAVGQLNGLAKEAGFADNALEVRPYPAGRTNAPIRFSYMRYVAQGPRCGEWPTNLAQDYRNLNYHNFGCAQQRNLAAMVANPADLVTPRGMDPADAERRALVFDKYRQGKSPASDKGVDDSASSKAN
ncbi:MAG: CpaD family pilus assembly protein [Hyphomicrobiaceae bacterium]|nr:CpaD family pilus assembly protein [Hyphomicrobiaceae bacterium]